MENQDYFARMKRPGKADFLPVLELMSTCGIAEYGESDADEFDLQYDWDQMNLKNDVWIGLDENDKIIGYSAVVPTSSGVRWDLSVHPRIQEPAANIVLLNQSLHRTKELLGADKPAIRVTMYLAAVNQRDRIAAEQEGFSFIRSHNQMRIDMDQPPKKVLVPDGFELRSFNKDNLDERFEVYTLVQEAFSQPGRQAQAYEDWIASLQREDIFDPGLWHLLVKDGRIAGVNLSFIYPGLGWVRQLAVGKEWQGKGLGSLLLRHSFWEFWQRGYPQVGLGVSAQNSHALELYLRSGMYIKRQYREYQITITL